MNKRDLMIEKHGSDRAREPSGISVDTEGTTVSGLMVVICALRHQGDIKLYLVFGQSYMYGLT